MAHDFGVLKRFLASLIAGSRFERQCQNLPFSCFLAVFVGYIAHCFGVLSRFLVVMASSSRLERCHQTSLSSYFRPFLWGITCFFRVLTRFLIRMTICGLTRGFCIFLLFLSVIAHGLWFQGDVNSFIVNKLAQLA